jgi:hypothetical protein
MTSSSNKDDASSSSNDGDGDASSSSTSGNNDEVRIFFIPFFSLPNSYLQANYEDYNKARTTMTGTE